MVQEVIPYCRPCDSLHEESSCYVAWQILEQGISEFGSSEEVSSKPEYINAVGHIYPVSKEGWKKEKEYSKEVDNLTKNYGAMSTSKQIREMSKFKGITHQRKENAGTPESNQ